jgi:RNA polymerase sigma-70 factor (ECF subfamily)
VAFTDADRRLLKRCLAKEPDSWQEFLVQLSGQVEHLVHPTAHARTVRLTADDVDDLCADAFLQLLAHDAAVLRRFRGRSSLATYLTVVVRRIVVREMARRRKVDAAHLQVVAGTVGVADDSAEQQRIDDRDEVRRIMADLPEQDALIVRMFHLEGFSYAEISHRLNIPENSIGPTLARARERLREQHARNAPA